MRPWWRNRDPWAKILIGLTLLFVALVIVRLLLPAPIVEVPSQ